MRSFAVLLPIGVPPATGAMAPGYMARLDAASRKNLTLRQTPAGIAGTRSGFYLGNRELGTILVAQSNDRGRVQRGLMTFYDVWLDQPEQAAAFFPEGRAAFFTP